jgi:hypothetical protein
MKSKDRKRNNNKNNTNDYKLESGAPARPKFLGSGSSNNNKNNNIYNKKNLSGPSSYNFKSIQIKFMIFLQ